MRVTDVPESIEGVACALRTLGSLDAVIDIRELRDNPDAVRRSQQARGEDVALVDQVLAADTARRASLAEFERLRAGQKDFGKQVAAAAGADK